MTEYISGRFIKKLREDKNMTQASLGGILGVSDKAISKWETGRGYPDISLIAPLADALGISAIELLSSKEILNTNRSANMQKVQFYVCPVCGNVITAVGQAVVSCCGITLPPLEYDEADSGHAISIEKTEDEYYITINHDMSKEHYISFIAAVKDNGIELTKLYPQSAAECYFKISRTRYIYYYCNRHGLFRAMARKK